MNRETLKKANKLEREIGELEILLYGLGKSKLAVCYDNGNGVEKWEKIEYLTEEEKETLFQKIMNEKSALEKELEEL